MSVQEEGDIATIAGATQVTCFRAFGLTIRSEFACPGTWAEPDASDDEVRVEGGEVAATLGPSAVHGHRFESVPGELVLRTLTIADFQVSGGARVRVQPKPDADPTSIADLITGWCAGSLLLQREVLALHAATIDTPTGAVAFCGDSGVGKSTLVGLLLQRGLRAIDDNIAALRLAPQGPIAVQPGLGSIRLTPQSLQWLGRSSEGLHALSRRRGKFLLPLDAASASRSPRPLRRIFLLERSAVPMRQRLDPLQRVEQLTAHHFVARYAAGLGVRRAMFEQMLRVARDIPIERLGVPADRSPQAFADDVARDLLADR